MNKLVMVNIYIVLLHIIFILINLTTMQMVNIKKWASGCDCYTVGYK